MDAPLRHLRSLSSLLLRIAPAPAPIDVRAFQEIPTPVVHRWSKPAHPFTGAAVIDVDSDGDQNLFFSNLGVSIPAFLTRGDLRQDQRHEPKWLSLRNDGDFKFTNVTERYGLTGYGFA